MICEVGENGSTKGETKLNFEFEIGLIILMIMEYPTSSNLTELWGNSETN